ncbi:T9SS type A sorting domain-containing protein [Cochleicola gelatinilyticus]|uniref:Secretion system C-terminal sorting domain-containing protein n=1 Tax=Cochleicola gelatinilyticus TaxID=1763537 RepID=A0A167H2L3_9FLAO|nr:T9SS type A sorting domain-containing protein [Cochleicola gelatinilyticus]OAB78149.1 hypothetical protein ULVI_11750 [Cochleicola gelatinilyticus]
MKKVTLTIALIVSTVSYAQQISGYHELGAIDLPVINATNQQATITQIDDLERPIIGVYTTLDEFNTALSENCSETSVTSEDFTGGPAGITECGPTVSSDGDSCFAAGELEVGFTVSVSTGTVINIPPGAIGNTDSLVGATTFAEFTIINFDPNVYAVAMDVWENNDPTTLIRVYGEGDVLIEELSIDAPTNSQNFFGVITDEPITKIELEGANGSGELFGNFIFGGDCLLGVNTNTLSQISVFPNPTTGILKINIPSGIEIENSVMYDVLGKVIPATFVNGELNISSLQQGVYILKINTNSGVYTQQIIKE